MGRNTMTVTVLALHEPSMSTIRLIKGAQILKILKNYSMKKLIENINDWARYFMWMKKIVQFKHLKAQLGPPVNDEKCVSRKMITSTKVSAAGAKQDVENTLKLYSCPTIQSRPYRP